MFLISPTVFSASQNSTTGTKTFMRGSLKLFFKILSVSGVRILAGFMISTGLNSDNIEHKQRRSLSSSNWYRGGIFQYRISIKTKILRIRHITYFQSKKKSKVSNMIYLSNHKFACRNINNTNAQNCAFFALASGHLVILSNWHQIGSLRVSW